MAIVYCTNRDVTKRSITDIKYVLIHRNGTTPTPSTTKDHIYVSKIKLYKLRQIQKMQGKHPAFRFL